MTRDHSNDLRERVVRAHAAGEPIRSVAARCGVGVSSVPKWVARWRASGSVTPDRMGGRRPRRLETHRDLVHRLVGETPHLTIDRLQDLLAAAGIAVCRDTGRFLRREGLRSDGLGAPCVFDGPINGRCFQAWVEQPLVPTLRPGDIVILDNLASHKGRPVRQAIRSAGARLWFLPPCSPDLNPIEQTFAKIKHWMRDAQKRTVDGTWRHLGNLIDTIQPDECRNYIRNDGYGSN